MLTIQTIAIVDENGVITAQAPQAVPTGRHRAVIVLDESEASRPGTGKPFPDLAGFRQSLGAPAYEGNTVLDLRDDERS